MLEAIAWMVLGAIISFVVTRIVHNKNFKKALDEEVAKVKSQTQGFRTNLKDRL